MPKNSGYLSKVAIKSWAEADRPREKLLINGRRHLTDVELAAILIRSGTRDESAVALSRRIFQAYNNDLAALSKASVADLCKFNGMGEAKALAIVSALELGRRHKNLPASNQVHIKSSIDIFDLLLPDLADLAHEEFWILLVNRGNMLLSKNRVSIGGQSGTVADPKIIFRMALEQRAIGIVLAHNHPSGQLIPSTEDIRLTKKLVEAARLLDMQVLDHLIITDKRYFSFADEGMI